MVPYTQVIGEDSLPSSTSYWTPDRSDLALGEGFGFFRDSWTILDVPREFAQQVVETEWTLVECLSTLTNSSDQYERLAQAVDSWDPDEKNAELSADEYTAIDSILRLAEDNPLDNLELGVSGLSLALSSIGAYPAASCRGHTQPLAWSKYPVVYFSATRNVALYVEAKLRKSACRFMIDNSRPTLLCIGGSSVIETIRLSRTLLEA